MITLIMISTVLVVIALVWTLIIFKQEENKMKKYEAEGDSVEAQLRRSHEYEKSSLKTGVNLQIIIYSVFTVLSLIAFLIYIY